MSFTPFNAPLLSGLLGDMEIASRFSVKADIEAMLKFEAALARAQVAAGLVPIEHAEKIEEICSSFEPDLGALQGGVVRDGMAVPNLVQQLRIACGGEVAASLHFGATSQDLVDTSLTMRLVDVNQVLKKRLGEAMNSLEELENRFGDNPLMARTRMQAALPVTVKHRLQQWRAPLVDLQDSLTGIAEQLHVVQLGGPVGDLAKMEGKGETVRADLAKALGLNDAGGVWHTDRSRLLAYCNWLSSLCGAIGKIGQDVALMTQNEIAELKFEGAGTSSAMAHKQNPVLAEVLVTLSRFSATLVSGMHHNQVHEQERSGISWTFEWLVLPQLCIAAGASLRSLNALLASTTDIGANSL